MFKKIDAETVVVVIVCGALLISWNFIFGPSGLDWMPKQHVLAKPASPDTIKNITDAVVPPSIEPSRLVCKDAPPAANREYDDKLLSDVKPALKVGETSLIELPDIKISNPLMDVFINPARGSINSIDLKKFGAFDGKSTVLLNKDATPAALSVTFPQSIELSLTSAFVESTDSNSAVIRRIFTMADGTILSLRQSWVLSDEYVIRYKVDLQNESGKEVFIPELLFWVGAMPPVKYLAGDQVLVSESHGVDRCMVSNDAVIETRASEGKFEDRATQDNPVKWIGVSNKYFSCVLKPSSPFSDGNISKRDSKSFPVAQGSAKEEYFIVSSAGCIKKIALPGHSEKSWDFAYYAGPKSIRLLKDFDPQAPLIMHLAWRYIDSVSQWLLYGLIFLKDIAGSYGMAIILLTLIVKLLFWPITHKSNQSMKKMQKIQPMIVELREKYKDDKQKMNTKLMELYKREKINPLGGCLPILLQIPVFIALYWTLDGAIELRHTQFLWAADLTRPDTVYNFCGLPINPLAIMMAATMFIQQKMTPTAMDPVQEKMMLIMPIIMLFFLYNLPSGLTLYWTVSQIISIGQLVINKYFDRTDNPKNQNLKTA